ncbi:MAG: hypothetical protein KKC03_14130 [Bacteroidetes bacterium]|nr:hypothetical protein [Bacteroidota bacterium]
MKITDENLREMKAMITADEADDPEEILNWFVENGPILIDEILGYRMTHVEL